METTKLELAEMLANGSKIAVEGKIQEVREPKNIISPEGYAGKPYNFWAQKIRIKGKEGHTLGCDVSFYHEADKLSVGQTVVLEGVMSSWTGRDKTEHKDLQKAKVLEFITNVNDDIEEEEDNVPESPPIVGGERKKLVSQNGDDLGKGESTVKEEEEAPFPEGSTKAKPVQSGNKPTQAQVAKAKMDAFEKKDTEKKMWLDKDERISRCVALDHGCGLIKEGKLSLGDLKRFIDEFVASSFHNECSYKLIDKVAKVKK